MALEILFTVPRNGTERNISRPENPIPSVGCLDVPRSETIKSALGNRYCSEANGLAQGTNMVANFRLDLGRKSIPLRVCIKFAAGHYRIAGVMYEYPTAYRRTGAILNSG